MSCLPLGEALVNEVVGDDAKQCAEEHEPKGDGIVPWGGNGEQMVHDGVEEDALDEEDLQTGIAHSRHDAVQGLGYPAEEDQTVDKDWQQEGKGEVFVVVYVVMSGEEHKEEGNADEHDDIEVSDRRLGLQPVGTGHAEQEGGNPVKQEEMGLLLVNQFSVDKQVGDKVNGDDGQREDDGPAFLVEKDLQTR